MRFIYNILFSVFFYLSAPFYFFKMWRRGGWKENFGHRFGRFDAKVKQALTNRHIIWLHAVSVGEVNICMHLIQALEPRIPNIKIVVSTTTSTGMGELKKRLPSHIQKIYYPIDRKPWVWKALGTIHPEAVILIEAEIWPNFIWRCRDLGIPTFLINARLSERSRRGYRFWGFLFRPLFQSLAGVGCQNQEDAEKLVEIGCRPEAVRVLGSLKFDSVKLDERRLLDVPALLKQLGVDSSAPVLVAGSTHAGEEAVIGEIFLKLRARFKNLFLIVVPRHAERAKDAGRDMEAQQLRLVYRTQITAHTAHAPGAVDCLMVNTTGELKYFYERANVIFVGKSLKAHGGQNPIEPGAMGKPMVFGPNMENFAAIAGIFVAQKGAVQVRHAAELEQVIGDLLADPARSSDLGRNALRVVQENQGAIERTVEMVIQKLNGGGLHIE
ncbi:MAG: 3-deoxy-D-manno-octulosonic acid transferase [Verrucomicrobiales bacterium]|nr:3-deoxy-D-manno-octulosonic acid transferase [Verrucomicrobiales bacterium]